MIFAFLTLGALALAADPAVGSTAFVPRPVAGWAIAELRGGFGADPRAATPMICGELAPYRLVALEACGSGAGFLYPAGPDVVDVAHFRAEATIPALRRGRAELYIQPGVGFAEIQRGQDAPGFVFGAARSPEQREGAGPEVTVAAKARGWASERAYVTGEVVAGAAVVPSAPVVLGVDPVLPFVTASVGVGF